RDGELACHRFEGRDIDRRGMPHGDAANDAGGPIDRPEAAYLPFQAIADRLENTRRRFAEGRGFGQDTGHAVLRRGPPLGALAFADVTNHLREAAQVARLVTQRGGGNIGPKACAILAPAPVLVVIMSAFERESEFLML